MRSNDNLVKINEKLIIQISPHNKIAHPPHATKQPEKQPNKDTPKIDKEIKS
jgi:hypothetical protein